MNHKNFPYKKFVNKWELVKGAFTNTSKKGEHKWKKEIFLRSKALL